MNSTDFIWSDSIIDSIEIRLAELKTRDAVWKGKVDANCKFFNLKFEIKANKIQIKNTIQLAFSSLSFRELAHICWHFRKQWDALLLLFAREPLVENLFARNSLQGGAFPVWPGVWKDANEDRISRIASSQKLSIRLFRLLMFGDTIKLISTV